MLTINLFGINYYKMMISIRISNHEQSFQSTT